jgi:hypothetical protein
MLLFRSEEHVERWCAAWRQPVGALLTLEQTWRLARAWYSPDRREPSWRRFTLDETEALLGQLGLTDPFWSLR